MSGTGIWWLWVVETVDKAQVSVSHIWLPRCHDLSNPELPLHKDQHNSGVGQKCTFCGSLLMSWTCDPRSLLPACSDTRKNIHHTAWVMWFCLTTGAVLETPTQADLQIWAIKIIPVLALSSPAAHSRDKVYS
jgi:hypothetical protein